MIIVVFLVMACLWLQYKSYNEQSQFSCKMKTHSFRLLDICEVNVWADQTNTSRALCYKWACSMFVVTSTIFCFMCVALLYQGHMEISCV
jgi:hypothetical protein